MIHHEPHVELTEFRSLCCPGVLGIALCRVDGVVVEPLVVTTEDDGSPLVSSKPVVWLASGVGIDLAALFGGLSLDRLPRATRTRVIQLAQLRANDVIADGGA